MRLTTVVAFKNSPLARNGHATIFGSVGDDFEKTLDKMDLLKKKANLREVRCLNKFVLSYGDESIKTFTPLFLHLLVREEFSSL